MVKVGDRVTHFRNMSLVGTVIHLVAKKSSDWMVGGQMGESWHAVVRLDKGDKDVEFPASDLMRLE